MKIFSSLEIRFLPGMEITERHIIVWLAFFLLVLVFIYPLRASLKTAFGNSMITERLAGGLDIEVFADLDLT